MCAGCCCGASPAAPTRRSAWLRITTLNFINAAQQGGMEAVCRTEHFAEVIASNPANRARLTALDPQRFIGIMEEWRRAFKEGAQHPVIGLSPSELRSLTMPACI